MNKLIALAFATLLAGCVSGTVDDDITKTTKLNFASSSVNVGASNVSGTISTSTTFDIHDAFSSLKDVGDVSISVNNDELDALNGDFSSVQGIRITLSSTSKPEVDLANHQLDQSEQHGMHLSLPVLMDSHELFNYLESGQVKLSLYLTGNLGNNIPINYTHTITLHASVSVSKSL